MAQLQKSAFDFTDELGSDPMMRRYGDLTTGEMVGAGRMAGYAAAKRQSAEAQLAIAQADLAAKLAPMKAESDLITTTANLMKQRSDIERTANIQRQAAALASGIPQAKNLDELITLGRNNLMGVEDPVAGPQYMNSLVNSFRFATDNAQSPVDVDAAYAKLDATTAALPEVKTAYDNARNQAALRQSVREKFAAEPSLGAVPTTTAGGVDVTAAGLALAAKGGEEARKEKARENIKLLQRETSDLESYMAKEMQRLGIEDLTPQPGVVIPRDLAAADLRLRNYRKNLESLYNELGIGDSATGVQPPKPTPEQAPPTEPTGGMPKPWQTTPATGATEPSASDKAAQASAVATGGETPPPTPAAETRPTPTPVPEPISLEEEIAQTAEAKKRERIIQSVEPKLKARQAARESRIEKAQRRARLKTLQDEKERLTKAIADAGLGEDSDVIVRAKNRIAEIDQELSK